eukprot:4315180-Alexandrium_andersonii.AAC.1
MARCPGGPRARHRSRGPQVSPCASSPQPPGATGRRPAPTVTVTRARQARARAGWRGRWEWG